MFDYRFIYRFSIHSTPAILPLPSNAYAQLSYYLNPMEIQVSSWLITDILCRCSFLLDEILPFGSQNPKYPWGYSSPLTASLSLTSLMVPISVLSSMLKCSRLSPWLASLFYLYLLPGWAHLVYWFKIPYLKTLIFLQQRPLS